MTKSLLKISAILLTGFLLFGCLGSSSSTGTNNQVSNSNVPTTTLSVIQNTNTSSSNSSIFYSNVLVIDSLTQEPVIGALLTYNDSVLGTQTIYSQSDGSAILPMSTSTEQVSISDSGYTTHVQQVSTSNTTIFLTESSLNDPSISVNGSNQTSINDLIVGNDSSTNYSSGVSGISSSDLNTT